jgi:transketolase
MIAHTIPGPPMIATRKAFGEALVELGAERPDLLVLDADVGTSTMAALFQKKYPERYIEVGIAEANMIGIAAGLSLTGYTPFVSSFAVFISKRALDQVSISIAYPALNVKINGSYGGIPTGRAGATHQALEDIAILRAIPTMRVLAPADAVETRLAVRLAMETPGPVYLRTERCEVPTLFDDAYRLEWGKAATLREGTDVAIVATGMMTAKALDAAAILAGDGIAARVIHMPSIKPLDVSAVVAASMEIGKIVTVENHSVIGGLGGAVAEALTEHAPCFLKRLGLPDVFGESGDDEAIFCKFGCNTAEIATAAREMAKGR